VFSSGCAFWFCISHLELMAKFSEMLVGVAIVFPVFFSIGSTYSRGETSLQRYADFKGHVIPTGLSVR